LQKELKRFLEKSTCMSSFADVTRIEAELINALQHG